jgi:hypothetical protein
MVIGETNQIESDDKDKLQDITSRVRDLNARLNDIRREQVFQRVGVPPPPSSFTLPSYLPFIITTYMLTRNRVVVV